MSNRRPGPVVNNGRFSKDLQGILNPPRAVAGPRTVQIDLTNNCNNDCIACWCHSSLLEERRISGAEKRKELSWDVIRPTLDDLAALGTEEIVLAGSGEPFMHTRIWEVIEAIARHKMRCNLITNATLLDAEDMERLVRLGIHMLTVSLWAGSPDVYAAIHPNKSAHDFDRIARSLQHLHRCKAARGSTFPILKIANVILRQNAQDIESMVDFGLLCQADHMEFNLVDIVAGKTDGLRLSLQECASVKAAIETLRARADYVPGPPGLRPQVIEGFGYEDEIGHLDRFLRIPPGWRMNFETFEITCPRGQTTGMHYPFPDRSGFTFQLNRERCQACREPGCALDHTACTLDVRTMSLSNCNTLLRRAAAAQPHASRIPAYDAAILNRVPCYVGWIYARILVSGDVVPCCKGHRMVLGNIYHRKFREIWHSLEYNRFRAKALSMVKSAAFFAPIKCFKGCDNLEMILDVHRRLGELKANQNDIKIPCLGRKESACL